MIPARRSYSRSVIPVQEIVTAALATVLRKAPLTPEKVAFAWRCAVGPAVSHATSATLDGRVLRVTAVDRAWLREVRRLAPLVVERLNAVLDDAVDRIDFSEPRTPARSGGESGSARRRR